MRRRMAVLAVGALVLVTGACGDGGDEDGDAAATSTTAGTEEEPTGEEPTGEEPTGEEPAETTGGAGTDDPAAQEYLDAANAECRAAFDQVADVQPPSDGDGVAVAEYFREVSAINTAMIEEIRGLEGPPDLVAQVEPILGEMEAALEDTDRLADLAAAGDQAGYEELGAEIEAATETINQDLASIGLTTCAED